MRKVIVESPFAGNMLQRYLNRRYARRCMHDALSRGEAPFASHLLYTQPGILNDAVPAQRRLGIEAGLIWGRSAVATVVYIDRGVSNGMRQGIERAFAEGRAVEHRKLGRRW